MHNLERKIDFFILISQNFVPMALVDNKSASVQVMAWRLTGDRSLPEPRATQYSDAYMRRHASMSE